MFDLEAAPGRTRSGGPAWMWLLVALAFGNACAYAAAVANPLVTEDNWTFLDTFLSEAVNGRLDLGDFLVKRAGLDHGQPLNKLAMWVHYRWFGLDFAIESLIGMAAALLSFLLLVREITRGEGDGRRGLAFCAAIAAIAAVHVSLNASYLYQFTLVTLAHLAHLVVLLAVAAAWRALDGGSLAVFAAAMLALAVTADMSAVLSAAALVLAGLLYGVRMGRHRQALRIVAVVVLSLLAARLLYAVAGEVRGATQAAFNVGGADRIAALWAARADAWKWVVVPLASGLVDAKQLRAMLPGAWQPVQVVLAAAMAAAHAWFWHSVFTRQPRAARFFAAFLMLSCYAHVAGIVYGRVFLRGAEYLEQQRYVLFYQLHVIALLLMAAARQLDPVASARPRRGTALALASAVVLALQVPLSLHSWRAVPDIVGHHRAAAAQFAAMARDPVRPVPCSFSRRLCELTPAGRARVVAMLREHRLGLYSPRFRRVHPDLADAAALGPP
jgi:hypothetical protein